MIRLLLLVITLMLLVAPSASAISGATVLQNGVAVTSFNFPTNAVSGGRVRSPDFTLRVTSGSIPNNNTWRGQVEVVQAFTGPGGTISNSAFAVQGPVQGTGFADLSVQRTFQTNIARNTTTTSAFRLRFIPPTGLRAGDYNGRFRVTAAQYSSTGTLSSSSTVDLQATVHILGKIAFLDIINVTADVRQGQTPGSALSSLAFPTQTVGGGKVRSDTIKVRATANTPWDLYAQIDAPFVKIGEPAKTKAVTSFGFCFSPCSSVTYFTGSSVGSQIADAVPAGSPASSPNFMLVSGPMAQGEAGDYSGSITFTILVD